jgi:hypothetical protein
MLRVSILTAGAASRARRQLSAWVRELNQLADDVV